MTGPRAVENTVIIPAFNEEAGIEVVLERVLQAVDSRYEVLVVDDGSTDRTVDVATRFPCAIIEHGHNRGKGEAVQTGIRRAQGDTVIWIDADDTYPAATIPSIARALSDGYDLVFASRQTGRNYIPPVNRVGKAIITWAVQALYRSPFHDPCTGLAGARKACLERMHLRSHGFGIESEIALKAGRMGLRTLEIPIEYCRRIGYSKLSAVRAGMEISGVILSHLLWREAHRQFSYPTASVGAPRAESTTPATSAG